MGTIETGTLRHRKSIKISAVNTIVKDCPLVAMTFDCFISKHLT